MHNNTSLGNDINVQITNDNKVSLSKSFAEPYLDMHENLINNIQNMMLYGSASISNYIFSCIGVIISITNLSVITSSFT